MAAVGIWLPLTQTRPTSPIQNQFPKSEVIIDGPYFSCTYFWSLKTRKIIARNQGSKICHKAISYRRFLRTENELFRAAKPIVNLIDPKLVIFQAKFFGFHFRVGLQPEMGLHFRSRSRPKMAIGFGFPHTVGSKKRCNKPKTAAVRVVPTAASICQARNMTCAACRAPLPTPTRLRLHHEPMGSGCCDGVD